MNGLWMPYVAEQGRVHVGLAGTGRILCGTTIRLPAAEWSDAIDLLDKRGPCRLCLRCLRAHALALRSYLPDDHPDKAKEIGSEPNDRETIGWSDCGHDTWRQGVVLDPFAGSGTTLKIATGHGREAIGIDLDERNADLAIERVGPMFLTIEHLSEPG